MRGPALVIVVVLLSIVTSIGTVLGIERLRSLAPAPPAAPPTVGVPSLKGLSEEDARQNLKALGLIPLIGERKAASGAKPGTVVEQAPAAGLRVEARTSVTIALARELPKVPGVIGRTLTEATAVLAQEGYRLEPGEPIADAHVPKGSVVAQLPDAEAPLETGQAVVVRLSSGPGEIEVPRMLGQNIEKVKAQAKELGVTLKIVWTAVGETDSLVVLNQNPVAGTKVKPGDVVTVVVNH
jgi:eukaryotic-like serine/threonine-protein kinase